MPPRPPPKKPKQPRPAKPTVQVIERGEVWYAHLDPIVGHEQAGYRPVLIVSVQGFNASHLGLVTVLPITSREHTIPGRVRLDPPEGGLERVSYIITEQIRTISKQRLTRRLGRVDPRYLEPVSRTLRILLGL